MSEKKSLLDEIDNHGIRLAKAEADLYDLMNALSHAFDGTAKIDAEGKYVYVNDLYAKNFGYTTKDLEGLPWHTTIVDGDKLAMSAAVMQCKETGRSEIEAKGLRKNGTIFWKKMALVRIPPQTDKPFVGYYAFVRDITEQKRAATELQRSEQRFSTLVRATSQIIYVRDEHGYFSEPQPSWQAFTGQSYDDYKEFGWLNAIAEEDRLRVTELWARAILNESIYEAEYRLHRIDGEYRDMFARAAPVFNAEGEVHEWIGSCEDITESKKLKSRFQGLTNAMPQLVWTTLSDGSPEYRNQQWYQYTGLDPNDKDNSQSTIHPDDLETVNAKWAISFKDITKNFEMEMRIRRVDGVYRWFLVRATPVLSSSGKLLYWIGTSTDIDNEKRAQKSLKVSRVGLQSIVDGSMDAIVTIDEKGLIIEWNPAAVTIFGWERSETLQQPITALLIPDDARTQHLEGMKTYLATGEHKILNRRIEVKALHKSGILLDVELTVIPIHTENTILFTAYIRDITEKKHNDMLLRLRDQTLSATENGIFITNSFAVHEPIIYCNPAFEKLTCYSKEEVIGQTYLFLQGPQTDTTVLKRIKQSVKSSQKRQVRFLNYRKDGTPFWNNLTLSPVFNDAGERTNYIGVQYEIESIDPLEIPAADTSNDSESAYGSP